MKKQLRSFWGIPMDLISETWGVENDIARHVGISTQ